MIGKMLKELRIQGDFTQQQISDILGLERVTYAGYESDRRSPDFQTLINIADYYNISLDYLLGRKKQVYINKMDIEYIDLVKKYNNKGLSVKKIEKILETALSLVDIIKK